MTTTTTALANTGSFDQLLAETVELGKQAGLGKDTQIKFYLKVVEGSFHGKIDLDASKHGTDIDDAAKLAEAYVKAQSGAVVFDAKAPNQRKAISCVRTCIKLGMWPKGGSGEPLASVNSLMTLRQKMRANPVEAKKLEDAGNSLLKYARAQIKLDQLIPQGDFKEYLFKAEHTLRTPEDILGAIRKQAVALKEGKASSGTAHDTSPEITKIITACTDRLKAIVVARNAPKVATPTTITP